jgi:toxin secretion/phage lysis holin
MGVRSNWIRSDVMSYLVKIWTALTATGLFLVGGLDDPIRNLFILSTIDYITGVGRAIYKGELNSYIGFKGLIKKTMIYAVVALGVRLDSMFGTEYLKAGLIFSFMITEVVSISENVGTIVPLPNILRRTIKQLKEVLKEEEEKKKE